MAKENVFVKITNRMIYDKLESIDKRSENIEKHAIKTNGKVKTNRWIATTAISLVVIIIGFLIKGGIS